jgi:hypothetical protein
MTDTKKAPTTIKQIIFWLRMIDDFNKVIKFMDMNCNTKGKLVAKPRTLVARISERLGYYREVELSDEVQVRLYEDFEAYVKHLEDLVAKSDPQFVEVAKAIYNGEITPKGFEF